MIVRIAQMQDLRAGGLHERRFGSADQASPSGLPPAWPAQLSGVLQRRFGGVPSNHAAVTPLPTVDQGPPPSAVNPSLPAVLVTHSSRRTELNRSGPRLRTPTIGKLPLPHALPTRTAPSKLALAGSHYARVRAQAMATGDIDMALRSDIADVMAMHGRGGV